MKKRNLKKEPLYFIVFFTFVMFLHTFDVTTSRYSGKTESEQDIIAVPILNFNNQELTCYITDPMLPGDNRECYFSISNKEEDKINEILLNYYFTISSTTTIPLNYELYEEINSGFQIVSMINNGNTSEKTTVNKTMDYKNDEESEIVRLYKLKIIWDAKDNDYTYAYNYSHTPIEIKVKLVGLQVIDEEL